MKLNKTLHAEYDFNSMREELAGKTEKEAKKLIREQVEKYIVPKLIDDIYTMYGAIGKRFYKLPNGKELYVEKVMTGGGNNFISFDAYLSDFFNSYYKTPNEIMKEENEIPFSGSNIYFNEATYHCEFPIYIDSKSYYLGVVDMIKTENVSEATIRMLEALNGESIIYSDGNRQYVVHCMVCGG